MNHFPTVQELATKYVGTYLNSTMDLAIETVAALPAMGSVLLEALERLGLPKDQTRIALTLATLFVIFVIYFIIMSTISTFVTLFRLGFRLVTIAVCAVAIAYAYGMFDFGEGGTLVVPPMPTGRG